MFTNRTPDGRNNICGIKVKELRKGLRISQRLQGAFKLIRGKQLNKPQCHTMNGGDYHGTTDP